MAQGDIQDVRVFDGTKWESLIGPQGPPGPPEVSRDPENNITIGGDGLPYYKTDYRVPAPNGITTPDNTVVSGANGSPVYADAFPVVFGEQAFGPKTGSLVSVPNKWKIGGEAPVLALFQDDSSVIVGINPDNPDQYACRIASLGDIDTKGYYSSMISCDNVDIFLLSQVNVETIAPLVARQPITLASRAPSGDCLYVEVQRTSPILSDTWSIRTLKGGAGSAPLIQVRDTSDRTMISLRGGPSRWNTAGANGTYTAPAAVVMSCDLSLGVVNTYAAGNPVENADFSMLGDATFGPNGSINSQGAATFKRGSINRDGVGPKIAVPVLGNLGVNSTHNNSILMIGANVTLLVSDDANVPVGFECDVLITGSSTCRISTAAGVDLRYRTENKTGGLQAQVSIESPWGKAKLTRVASKVWYAEGNLSNASM